MTTGSESTPPTSGNGGVADAPSIPDFLAGFTVGEAPPVTPRRHGPDNEEHTEEKERT